MSTGPDDPTDHLPLAPAQFHVLVSLSTGEKHGYAIMGEVEDLSRGAVQMGPGTLYGTLKRLVSEGLAEETTAEHPAAREERRRYYRLTGLGERVCAAEARRLSELAEVAVRNLRPGLA